MPELNDQTIRRRLPYPVASAWHRVALAKSEAERIDRLLACSEILFRTLAALLLPDYLRGPASPAVEEEIAKLKRPTDGMWLAIVRELIRYLGTRNDPPAFIPEVRDWYFTRSGKPSQSARLLEEILKLRNQFSHRRGVPPKKTEERMVNLQSAVRSALGGMEWMLGYRPFRAMTITLTGKPTFSGKIQFLTGLDEQSEPVSGEWDSSLFLDQSSVYLANPAGSEILELSPFMDILPDALGEERVYLIKEAPGLKQIVRTHDATGTDVRTSVSWRGMEQPFDEWLASRNPLDFHRTVRSSNGVFRILPPDAEIEEGELGTRFENLGELGRGGMAVVYRVRDRNFDQEFALKILNADLADKPIYRERFRREALTMSKFPHSRIVPVLDIGDLPGGQPYLKMPVMARGSLSEKIVPHIGCAESAVRRWAEDALTALEHIHAAGLIHRDVKPSNFLLDDEERVALTDFGIALKPDEQRLTGTLDQIGTVMYMAPEQRTLRTVTEKADIYSLAVVLHELLAGELPEKDPGDGLDSPLAPLIRAMGSSSVGERPTATEALRSLRATQRGRKRATPLTPVKEQRPGAIKPRTSPGRGTRRTPAVKPDAESIAALAAQRERERQEAEAAAVLEAELRERDRVEAETRRVAEAAAQAERERKSEVVSRKRKMIALIILVSLFAVNYVETAVETWLRSEYRLGLETEEYLAEAAHWLEDHLDFTQHDATNPIAYHGYSIVYFFAFPLLAMATVVILARRRDAGHLMMFATAAAIDYAISLPLYLFFPVPERWAYPASNAILLSDLWTTQLIEVFRPISGLNNCFPSFHVSATVIVLVSLYRARVPFRGALAPIAAAIVLSTFALGIHWIADILAGIAAGLVSIHLAGRLLRASGHRHVAEAVPAEG